MQTLLNLLITAVILSFSLSEISAQCLNKKDCKKSRKEIFRKEFNSLKLKVGLGVLPTYLLSGGIVISPPITVGGEYHFSPKFSLGIRTGHSIQEKKQFYPQVGFEANVRNEHFSINARAITHFAVAPKWNLYGGALLGIHHSKITPFTATEEMKGEQLALLRKKVKMKPTNTSFAYSGIMGVKYYLSKKIGLWGEISNDISLISTGLSFRVN